MCFHKEKTKKLCGIKINGCGALHKILRLVGTSGLGYAIKNIVVLWLDLDETQKVAPELSRENILTIFRSGTHICLGVRSRSEVGNLFCFVLFLRPNFLERVSIVPMVPLTKKENRCEIKKERYRLQLPTTMSIAIVIANTLELLVLRDWDKLRSTVLSKPTLFQNICSAISACSELNGMTYLHAASILLWTSSLRRILFTWTFKVTSLIKSESFMI